MLYRHSSSHTYFMRWKKLMFLSVLCCCVGLPALATPYNIAPRAKVTVSSQLNGQCGASCLTDGIIRVPGKGEWVSDSQMQFWGVINFPSVDFEWPDTVTISKVTVYDLPSLKSHTAACMLVTDGGQRIEVSAIPDNGAPREVSFAPVRTKHLKVELTDGDGVHLGLSEIEIFPPAGSEPDFVSAVDPYIETGKGRYFFFATGSMPFGMISAAPLTRNKNQGGGGYNYNDNQILGFPQLHAWMMSGLDFMPVTGMPYPLSEDGWKSTFSHEGEIVQPAYHRLYLDKYDLWVEQTCTDRASLYRMTFTRDADAGMLLNLGGYLGTTTMVNAHVARKGRDELEGYFDTTGRLWGGSDKIRVFFIVRFSEPFEKLSAWSDDRLMENVDSLVGPAVSVPRNEGMSYHDAPSAGVRAGYQVRAGQQLLVKMAISYTGIEHARNNLESELPGWNFDEVRKSSQDEWNQWLGHVEVKGGSLQQRVKFYTDLWHVLLGRHKIDDCGGYYPDYTQQTKDGNRAPGVQLKVRQIAKGKFHMYSSDSFWLTQWNLNTLWGLAWPRVFDNFCASMVQYSQNGSLIPRGPNCGGYSYIMSGCPVTSMLSGAYQRGIDHLWNPQTALDAMVRNHLQGGMMAHGVDGDLDFYVGNGYVPDRGGLTVEWAFQDWALAEMAQRMGRKAIARQFHFRSHGWTKAFSPKLKLVMPRRRDGSWLHEDPLNGWGFEESNAWQTTFGLSHDLNRLADLMGGSDSLCARLDKAMTLSLPYDFVRNYGSGYVCYSNEPGLSSAHVFSHLRQPWLSQYWVRQVQQHAYGATSPSEGYGGEDEDQGQMACMSTLMAMGLFSIDGCCAVKPNYEITSPVFDEVIIHMDPEYYSGKVFRIVTHSNSASNCYIQRATLNGKEHRSFLLPCREFAKGGTLELWMGNKPNYQWGTD